MSEGESLGEPGLIHKASLQPAADRWRTPELVQAVGEPQTCCSEKLFGERGAGCSSSQR